MRLLDHDTSRAVRFFRLQPAPGNPEEHGPHLARAFENRYEFKQGPRTVEEYDLSRGVSFLQGRFEDTLIERVQLFDNGMLVEGKVDTDELDRFIESAVHWAWNERGLQSTPNEGATGIQSIYFSQLIVEFIPSNDGLFAKTHELSRRLAMRMSTSGFSPPPIAFGSLTIGPEPIGNNANWGFRFERRLSEPFSSNKFFTTAPLATKSHLEFLAEFQTIAEQS